MEQFSTIKIIILFTSLKDYVQTSYVSNDPYTNQQYHAYGQPYTSAYHAWIPFTPNLYDYNNGYPQYPEQPQQQPQQQPPFQYPSAFQLQQQQQLLPIQYKYPTYQQYPPQQIEHPPYVTKDPSISYVASVTDPYGQQYLRATGQQQQMQTQFSGPQPYSNFQEQYQTNQVRRHPDGSHYETYQYQYQDGLQQTQEQQIVSLPRNTGESFHHAITTPRPFYVPTSNTHYYEPPTQGRRPYDDKPFERKASDVNTGLNLNTNPVGGIELEEPRTLQPPIVRKVESRLYGDPLPNNATDFNSDSKFNTRPVEEIELEEFVKNPQPYNPAPENLVKHTDLAEAPQQTNPITPNFITPNITWDSSDAFLCHPDLQNSATKLGNCSKLTNGSEPILEKLDDLCVNRTYGLYAHPYDCSKFVNCSVNGQAEMECANGTIFNSKRRRCLVSELVYNASAAMDSTQSTGISCPTGVIGRFAHPFSNEKFINCTQNDTSIISCPPGTYFTLSELYCEKLNYKGKTKLSSQDNKIEMQSSSVIHCPTSCNGSFLYPFDATKYVMCHGGKMQILSCAGSEDVYSVTKRICMSRAHSDVFDIVRPTEDIQQAEDAKVLSVLYKQHKKIECPLGILGLFPHPFVNTKYIKCVRGNLLIKRCRPGFLYSLSRKLCDIPDHIRTFDTAVPVEIVGLNFEKDNSTTMYSEDRNFLQCPFGVRDNFVFPFLNTRYTHCLNGVTEIETCLSGTIYSIRRKECVARDQLDPNDFVEGVETYLKKRQNDFSCSPDPDAPYAHPQNRRKFFMCQQGVVVVQACDVNEIFDMALGKCL